MAIHSLQKGLVLQNGFVFFLGDFHRWVYVLNNFTKWFWSFFQKNEKMFFFKEYY